MKGIIALGIAMAVDWIIGDPPWPVHPVILIGKLISGREKRIRKMFPDRLKAGGVLLAAEVLFWSFAVPGLILFLAWTLDEVNGVFYWLAAIWFGFRLLAAKSLYRESMKVCKALKQGDLNLARKEISMLVGRDTDKLDEEGIIRAAVETVAENTSDGVIAPMFYLALFGPLGGFVYKAANTLDSMVGYKNERYIEFGRASAKLDDLLNFLPARLTGVMMVAAAWLLGRFWPVYQWRPAWKIYKRDRKCHASPNSAQAEAACAGALGIRLGGDAWYFGTLHQKPGIGEETRKIEALDIKRAGVLMFATQILVWLLFVLLFAFIEGLRW